MIQVNSDGSLSIPKVFVEACGLLAGDDANIVEEEGRLYIEPAETYSEAFWNEIETDLQKLDAEEAAGSVKVFSTARELTQDALQ